jgi:hypothetical protein
MKKHERSEADEIAVRRDQAVRRMIATPPTSHKGDLKRPKKESSQKPGKRGS